MEIKDKNEKFFNKKWFAILMLVFFAPIGIFLIWKEKHFDKKMNKRLSIIFGIWFVIILVIGQTSEDNQEVKESKQEQTEQSNAEGVEEEEINKDSKDKKEKENNDKNDNNTEEKENKEKDDKEKKEKKKTKDKKPKRTTAEAIQEDSNNVDKATFEDGEMTLQFEPGTLWDENSFMGVVHDMFKDVKVAFDDKEVKSVLVMIDTAMIDEKGNEEVKPVVTYRYTREGFEELNYDNFIDMALIEEWRILNEADSYFIHPGIRKNLKDKYIQNLR